MSTPRKEKKFLNFSPPLNYQRRYYQANTNSKLLLIKILIIIEVIKMILTIKVIVIITIITTLTIIIKCRGRYKTPITTNTALLVTLHNSRIPLSNIKKSSHSDAVKALYTPLKRLIHHLT